MKIGILTLHDSVNYGALLQAYAMSRLLRSLGHDPVLIDRRRDIQGRPLKWELSGLSFRRRLAWFLCATGVWHDWLRRRRALRFLREKVGLTPYHFADWKNAPENLGVDLISVGSDQVWNATIHDPLDYLPERLPQDVPAISYAASIGMPRVPAEIELRFSEAARRFRAVSVREATAVDELARLGVTAQHVVDPVIATGLETWMQLLGEPIRPSGRVFVYLLGVDLDPLVKLLNAHAEKCDMEIDFFVGRMLVEPLTSHGHPRLLKNLRYWYRSRASSRFHLHLADGPESFVRAIASADAVVTSSYHALLFSVLFDRNVRFIVPDSTTPQSGMMVRINDYADKVVSGPLLQPNIQSAFRSIASEERTVVSNDELERRRRSSISWLESVL